MRKITTVSGMVLAGGLSTRIGKDKGQLALGKATLAGRSLENLGTLFEELIYVTNDPFSAPALPGMRVAKDDVPHLGPLGGILAGLKVSQAPRSFVVGYDMPFVSPDLVRFLIEFDEEADVVAPSVKGHLEPLHAVYSRACVPFIAKTLEAGRNRIVDFYENVSVSVVGEADVLRIDPELRSFFNVNTLADLELAARMIGEA